MAGQLGTSRISCGYVPFMPIQVPRVRHPDSTLPLLADPYRYISRQTKLARSPIVRGRLLLRPCTFLVGRDAAELFYDTDRFRRAGAMPLPVLKTLLGEGGVQGMDGRQHRRRKAMLLDVLMAPDRVQALRDRTERAWHDAVGRWGGTEISLYEQVQELLMRAVCDWAEVPLPEHEVAGRTKQVALLFDAAGAKNLRHLASLWSRERADRWIAGVISQVRSGELSPSRVSALHTLAWFRDSQGRLLPPENAAVGLLNVIRPVVAVSVFIVLAAHALESHPSQRPPKDDDLATEYFVQEVRRFYPFFPAVMAITRQDVEWRGFGIPRGERVVLDLHGTNHDHDRWGDPESFRSARFAEWDNDPFDFIPHGGGAYVTGHRCAGESLTVTLMKQAVQILAHRVAYQVPSQNLHIDVRRMPALPKSRFVIREVRWVDASATDVRRPLSTAPWPTD